VPDFRIPPRIHSECYPPLAHVAEDGRVHPLAEHLNGTAERAAQFAGEFVAPVGLCGRTVA